MLQTILLLVTIKASMYGSPGSGKHRYSRARGHANWNQTPRRRDRKMRESRFAAHPPDTPLHWGFLQYSTFIIIFCRKAYIRVIFGLKRLKFKIKNLHEINTFCLMKDNFVMLVNWSRYYLSIASSRHISILIIIIFDIKPACFSIRLLHN